MGAASAARLFGQAGAGLAFGGAGAGRTVTGVQVASRFTNTGARCGSS